MADNDSIVISLQDRHKNQIYDDFQRLLRQECIVLDAKGKSNYIRSLRFYRIKYVKLMTNIFETELYARINPEFRKILEDYRADTGLIKNKKQIANITMMCASIIRDMKITKISFDRKEEAF